MDITLASLLQFLHVAAGFAFVAGLIGRAIALGRARRSDDLDRVQLLVGVAGPFEKMVTFGSIAVLLFGLLTMWAQGRPLTGDGSWWLLVSLVLFLSVLPFVPLVFLPRGKVFEAALEEARSRGSVTPELTEAFADPVVAFARDYEAIVVAVVVALMVLKPF